MTFNVQGSKRVFASLMRGLSSDLSHVKLTIISHVFNMQNKSRDKLCASYQIITSVKPTVVSALGAIPKSNSKVRLIYDANRPLHLSVNDYVQSDCSCLYMDLRVCKQTY